MFKFITVLVPLYATACLLYGCKFLHIIGLI